MARADRGEQLLDTAEQVFAERGFRTASMEEIAERAGVTKPILYDHFGSKDGLLAAVVVRSGAALRSATQEAVAEAPSPADALNRGLRAYFTFIEAHAAAWTVLLTETEATGAAAEAVEAIRRDIGAFIAGMIAADLPDTDPARAGLYAQAIVGAAERLAMHARSSGSLDAQTLTQSLMDVIWLGLSSVHEGGRWS
jgi:AcrR family transcriptional regulator